MRISNEPTLSAMNAEMKTFNGGKMTHIFKYEGRPSLYTSEFDCEKAEEALKYGKAYMKIDGSNGMLCVVNDKIQAYRRQDIKGRDWQQLNFEFMGLPKGGNPVAVPGHAYVYRRILPEGSKGEKRLNELMLSLVEFNKEQLMEELVKCGGMMTIEWVGKKFQRTPGVAADVGIVIHHLQEMEAVPRTFEELRSFFQRYRIEGVVIEHKGTFYKIRANMFDPQAKIEVPPIQYII